MCCRMFLISTTHKGINVKLTPYFRVAGDLCSQLEVDVDFATVREDKSNELLAGRKHYDYCRKSYKLPECDWRESTKR